MYTVNVVAQNGIECRMGRGREYVDQTFSYHHHRESKKFARVGEKAFYPYPAHFHFYIRGTRETDERTWMIPGGDEGVFLSSFFASVALSPGGKRRKAKACECGFELARRIRIHAREKVTGEGERPIC